MKENIPEVYKINDKFVLRTQVIAIKLTCYFSILEVILFIPIGYENCMFLNMFKTTLFLVTQVQIDVYPSRNYGLQCI